MPLHPTVTTDNLVLVCFIFMSISTLLWSTTLFGQYRSFAVVKLFCQVLLSQWIHMLNICIVIVLYRIPFINVVIRVIVLLKVYSYTMLTWYQELLKLTTVMIVGQG